MNWFNRRSNDKGDSSQATDQSPVLNLAGKLQWKGSWSANDLGTLSSIVESCQRLLPKAKDIANTELLFLQGCAELELGRANDATASFDGILKVQRDHFGASVLHQVSDPSLSIFRHPLWSSPYTTVADSFPARREPRNALCVVRDGISPIVSAFLAVDRDLFPPHVTPDIRSGLECYLNETPFGPVPTFYFIFNTDPVSPFLWEQCLYYRGGTKERNSFVSALSLMRQLSLQKYLYIVPFNRITGEVIINKRQIMADAFRERLSAIVADISVQPAVETEEDFKKAIAWIGTNFDMRCLQWFTAGWPKEPIQGKIATESQKEKPTDSSIGIERLVHILNNPYKVEGQRTVHQFGTVETPNQTTLISIELIETEDSCQQRIAAARRLGEIGGVEAGKALANQWAVKCRDDVNLAICQSLNKVVKATVEAYPDSQLLPTRLFDHFDKVTLLFERDILEYVALALGVDALEFILSRLSKGNIDEKMRCLAALGKIRRDESAGVLLQYLSFPDNKVQSTVLNALAECGSRVAAHPLRQVYNQQSDRKQRRRFFRALLASLIPGQEIVEELQLLGDSLVDVDLEIRRAVTEYLLENQISAEHLRQELNNRPLVREHLQHLLDVSDASEHYIAVRGLGILGQSEDIASLERVKSHAKDSNHEVRNAVDKIRSRGL